MVWVNSHGLFVIGPFLVGCVWLAAAWRRWRHGPLGRTEGEEHALPDLGSTSRLLAAVSVATLITPLGPAVWSYAVRLATQVGGEAPA